MFRLTAVVLALSASALATLFPTAPVAATVWQAGMPQTISWQESTDGQAPHLKDFGPALISIYVGNAQQQTKLQPITTIDVSTTGQIQFTPDPKIGPNGAFYFIRFESVSLKDSAAPQFPALAFSAKFTLQGMTGTFPPDVQAQIDGASTAPIGGPTGAPPPATSAPASATSKPATSSTKPTSTSSAKPTTTSKSAADSARRFSGFALAGVAAAVGVALY